MERLKNILVKPDHTIKQALKQMDSMGEKTLLVVDDQNMLWGTVTDGDVRRWILKGRNLTENVSKVMNPKPISLKYNFERETAKNLMIKQTLECLPIVDDNKKVISAVWWVDLFENKSKKLKALNVPVVIMAGGEGSRLEPFTKILPKPLMPIGDRPIIEIIINRFMDYGCDDFYLSLSYKSNIIKAYFSDLKQKYKITYIHEKQPLGTAGSLHFLKKRIKKTFFMSNCDIVIDADYADILKFHQQQNNKITLVSSMKNFTVPYGVCEIKNGGILKNIHEKPEYNLLVNTGMYVLDSSVLKDIPKDQFYNATDLIIDYIKKKKKIGVYPISENSWVDIGQGNYIKTC